MSNQPMECRTGFRGRALLCGVWVAAISMTGPGLAAQLQPIVANQDKPDFSGRWVLESAAEPALETPRSLEVRLEGLTSTNVRGEPIQPFFRRIAIARELADGKVSETRELGIVGGTRGGLRPNTQGAPVWTAFGTKWEGGVLVLENSSGSGRTRDDPPWIDRREAWSLESGRLKIVITTSSSETPATSVTSFYRRP